MFVVFVVLFVVNVCFCSHKDREIIVFRYKTP